MVAKQDLKFVKFVAFSRILEQNFCLNFLIQLLTANIKLLHKVMTNLLIQ